MECIHIIIHIHKTYTYTPAVHASCGIICTVKGVIECLYHDVMVCLPVFGVSVARVFLGIVDNCGGLTCGFQLAWC